ncbi:uncharacterized protein LOC128241183 [Mya arenaria]|uniref:uncharacterized protein LOC128241183 n=1 Tax=Mya arenaria TaxID=6604 RepID=UPI0022E676EA|nr:uncharacterized protein LOC128241183 [Mya arenaria]
MSVYDKGMMHTLIFGMLLVLVAGRTVPSDDLGEKVIKPNGVVTRTEESLRQYSGPTVYQFAIHGLCNHRFGKVRFFRALRNHFHNISDDMKIAFVLDICKRRDQMLTKWVQEIFDNDGMFDS